MSADRRFHPKTLLTNPQRDYARGADDGLDLSRTLNWGQSGVQVGGTHALTAQPVRVQVDASDAREQGFFSLYAVARDIVIDASDFPASPVVDVEWGMGSGSVTETFDATPPSVTIPVLGNVVKATVRIRKANGTAASALSSATFDVFLARGINGLSIAGTRWVVPVPPLAASGVISTVPGRLVSLFAFNSLATTIWLMLFDSSTVPADGASPILTAPLPPSPGAVSYSFPTTHPFVRGLSWAVSTTAGTKTLAVDGNVRVDAELLR